MVAPSGYGHSSPAERSRKSGLAEGGNLLVFPLAAEMATAVGYGRFGRTKGAPGRTAGTALASGAYRMSVAADIAANIVRYRSRKTADEALRHGLPHRSGVTLARSECLILLQDRSRLWQISR